jgi:hypothetical protein
VPELRGFEQFCVGRLGGHLKTGHAWSLQKRPPALPRTE